MADPPNINAILAALAAQQRPGSTPSQGGFQPPPNSQQSNLPQGYPANLSSTPQGGMGGFQLPQPSNSGSVDLSNIKPVSSGTVSIAEAIAKARGIAAEKGVSYDGRSASTPNRDSDPRLAGRSYRRSRSRSRSPPPTRRDNFRDNYNPYRDERRGGGGDDRRGGGGRDYNRDRSYSPGPRDRRNFSPPSSRGYPPRGERSPPGRGGGSADDSVETIQIESSLVGLIIGRSGENLRRVETDTGARVQFVTGPDVSGPIRDCKITGNRAARSHAKEEINRIVEENGKPPVSVPLDRGPRSSSHQPALRDGEDSMQIMVPDRTVGLIIGRGGETIRDLQERSGCHVNIVGESKSLNGLRPVNLIGSQQAAAKAKELIMEIVDSDTKTLGQQGPPPREQSRGGPPGAYGAYGGGGGGGGYGGGGAGGGGGGGGGDRIHDSIRVPSEAVGMIIGKGGETIKDMQNGTGCKINVSQSSGPDEVSREIGLVGSRDAIDQAKRAIEEKVDFVRNGSRGHDPYQDRYSQSQQSYGQSQGSAMQGQDTTSQQGGEADPYAAYGGYNNYAAMWYAAMMQQQQQQGSGQGEPPNPPGTT